MISAKIDLGFDELQEIPFIFETIEDAQRYVGLRYGSGFGGVENALKNSMFDTLTPIKMPYWAKETPYIAYFFENEIISLSVECEHKMLFEKLIIKDMPENVTKIMFWSTGDFEFARGLAEAIHEGYKQAKSNLHP